MSFLGRTSRRTGHIVPVKSCRFRYSWRWIWALVLSGTLSAQPQAESGPSRRPETPVFESSVHAVLVPVVVRDRQSRVVKSLTRQDFQLFDDGKEQLISGFSVQLPDAEKENTSHAQSDEGSRTGAAGPAFNKVDEGGVPRRFVVLLFDDLHLVSSDFTHVKEAAKQVLNVPRDRSEMWAVISTSASVNTGFTENRATLLAAIDHLHPQLLYGHVRNCPDISQYQADLILNMDDSGALAEAAAEAQHCAPGTPADVAEQMARSAAKLELTTGEQGIRVALGTMQQVVRQMARLPGLHILVLASPGFLSNSPVVRKDVDRVVDSAAQGNVSVSALDGRGLYTQMIDMDHGYVSVQEQRYHNDALMQNGDILAELALETGGLHFENSNDLTKGFALLTKSPECVYLLQFSPTNAKGTGAYHRLKVKLRTSDMKVQARRGYFSPPSARSK